MSHYGQHSESFQASSSSLRILYEGTKNTYSTNLTVDAFTQTNPPIITTPSTVSTTLQMPPRGILGGSVCFTRPDAGNGFVGGPVAAYAGAGKIRPLGFFINGAADFTQGNQPLKASNQGAYVNGCLGTRIYETFSLGGVDEGDPIIWGPGDTVYASRNGYITNREDADNALEAFLGYTNLTPLGIVKVVADSVHPDIVFDKDAV